MKLLLTIKIILLLLTSLMFGQIENLRTHTQMNVDCKKCHICDTPTKANPCLIVCPRNKIEEVRHSPSEGPEDIILNEIITENDLYGPSHFTHRLHSEMSLMSGGCSICHHFNPPGKIVKCSTCHEARRGRTDLSKPDLKAAFHRQCMGCHKTWEKRSECSNCHLLNSDKSDQIKKETSKQSHPEVTIPVKVIYETDSDEGNLVAFYHNDHSSAFAHECSDCHNQESCASCHAEIKLESIKIDPHERCNSCHDSEKNCNNCHKDKVAGPFNHKVKTGFSLEKYHNNLNCRSCHKVKNKFTGLKGECTKCHSDSDGYFIHGITGLTLDENHIDNSCVDCHKSKNYSRKPECEDCHDTDISYPDSIPGERL